MNRFIPVLLICLAGLLLLPATASARYRVLDVRYSVDDAKTRIVLDTSKQTPYQVNPHSNPSRIAINIQDATAGAGLRPVVIGRGVVKRVRINRLSWGVQVVLDLREDATWKHFALARNASRSDRIVVDVMASEGGSVAGGAPQAHRYIIALDAGHGGKDPGTSGRYGLIEKKLTLDLARRVAAEINKGGKFRAVLTRKSDVYLTLPKRTAIAKNLNADLFVSIHLNSAPNRSARGAEVYFLSPAGAAQTASRVLANPKRAADDLGLTGGSSDLIHMLVDVNQQAMMVRSSELAESILDALGSGGLPPTRAVKQKSFAVLKSISMPSVLIEAGFLSNKYDAELIRNESGRQQIASAISDGIVQYLTKSPPPKPKDDKVIVHRVKMGDTLWRISRKYGTSINSIRRANRLTGSMLRVGQELIISNRF